jgi:hypothetical protein
VSYGGAERGMLGMVLPNGIAQSLRVIPLLALEGFVDEAPPVLVSPKQAALAVHAQQTFWGDDFAQVPFVPLPVDELYAAPLVTWAYLQAQQPASLDVEEVPAADLSGAPTEEAHPAPLATYAPTAFFEPADLDVEEIPAADLRAVAEEMHQSLVAAYAALAVYVPARLDQDEVPPGDLFGGDELAAPAPVLATWRALLPHSVATGDDGAFVAIGNALEDPVAEWELRPIYRPLVALPAYYYWYQDWILIPADRIQGNLLGTLVRMGYLGTLVPELSLLGSTLVANPATTIGGSMTPK